MGQIQVKAHAKINLTLDILGKRPDGYHEVEMIMQSISLHDIVTLRRAKAGVALTCDHPEVPLDHSNLAFKAVRVLEDFVQRDLAVDINIKKNIPVAAGLAGGSTNAAAVLTGLNKLYGLELTLTQLLELAAQLGSDVPFCVLGGTALAYSRGEKLKELPPMPPLLLVLAKPALGVSTAQVYREYRGEEVLKRPDTARIVKAIETQDADTVSNGLCNVLESVTLKLYPEVAKLKQRFIDLGCKYVLMSGSGPTVFAVVKDYAEGQLVADALRDHQEVFVACTLNSGKG